MVDSSKVTPVLTLTGMVSSDTGRPDPNNPNGEIKVSEEDVILVTDDEESDQETVITRLDEYQPLPADEESADLNHGYGSSEDEASGQQLPGDNASVPPILPMDDELVKEVWSTPTPSAVDIEMDSKKVDEVKQLMAGVTLPPGAIPEWATNIPEEEWKGQLLKRLQNLQGDKK